MPEQFGTAAAAQLPHLCRAKTSIKIHRQWGQELQLLHRVLATSQEGEGGKPGAHGARRRLCPLLQPPGLIQLISSTRELIEMPELFQNTNSGQIKAVEQSRAEQILESISFWWGSGSPSQQPAPNTCDRKDVC